jgi:hypothetical protein
VGLCLVLGGVPSSSADDQEAAVEADNGQETGVEAQGRGPVHEAFAEPGAPARPTPIIEKKPPEAIDEVPPDQKPDGDNIQWIPGYWAYDEDTADYMWVSGCWRAIPPGKQWMPGHWSEVANGFQWTTGFWADAEAQDTEVLPPPPQSIDAGPSALAPSVDSVYVSGTWVYRTRRYFWRPGFWYSARPDWVWVPAHYVWSPAGYMFVDGYWDYPLATRGLLFAPVVIEPSVWGRPRWVYRPRIVLYTNALLGSLFVRPDHGGYYFGDYFEPRYRKLGFVPWVDYRVNRYSPDPLYTYYRWQNRNNRTWDRDLRGLYVDRAAGRAARPPRTIVQQTTVINNITINKTNNNITNIRNVTMMAPITSVDRTVVKLQRVAPSQLAEQTKAARQIRTLSTQRQKITAAAVAKGPAPTRPTDVPKVTRLNLPTTNLVVKPKVVVRPPARPTAPTHVERTLPKHDPVKPIVIPKRVNPNPVVKPKPVIKPDPKPVPKPVIKPVPKPVIKNPDPKPVPKPVIKPVPKPVIKNPDPKPVPKPVIKPVPKPVIKKPDPKPVIRSEPKPVIKKPDPKPVVKPPVAKSSPVSSRGEKAPAHAAPPRAPAKAVGSHPARK